MTDLAWDDQKTNFIIGLYNEGFSYSEIAEQVNRKLGCSFSRSAIGGKIKRMKDRKSVCPRTNWTDDLNTRLKKYWREGKSTSEIKRLIGIEVSENAIRRKIKKLVGNEERQNKPNQKTVTVHKAPLLPLQYSAAFEPLEGTTPIDIMGLKPTTCRWPVGRGLYCGCHTSRAPYCSTHFVISIEPKVPENAHVI